MPISEIHPLHRAILNECCEHVEESDIDPSDEDSMVSAVQLAFKICESALKGTIKGLSEGTKIDTINLDYRGQKFEIKRGSYFLN